MLPWPRADQLPGAKDILKQIIYKGQSESVFGSSRRGRRLRKKSKLTLDVIATHHQPDSPRAPCVPPKGPVDNPGQLTAWVSPGLVFGHAEDPAASNLPPEGTENHLQSHTHHTLLLLGFFSIMVLWSYSSVCPHCVHFTLSFVLYAEHNDTSRTTRHKSPPLLLSNSSKPGEYSSPFSIWNVLKSVM